ncbi:helix-turn-helix domain-containing protein [Paenibacillus sp. NPDC057934]|uniref:helix-turn-helix domain-containing protein n=1 Tax=Paenibacillus sp. NPDC057934 TaxID=3346282 RepID=UPI0036DD1E2F
MKIEVTINIRSSEEHPPVPLPPVPEIQPQQSNTSKLEKLLPPVLNSADIQRFLRIGKSQVYELLNSGAFHVTRVGRRMLISRSVFIEWLEGRSEDNEGKRKR